MGQKQSLMSFPMCWKITPKQHHQWTRTLLLYWSRLLFWKIHLLRWHTCLLSTFPIVKPQVHFWYDSECVHGAMVWNLSLSISNQTSEQAEALSSSQVPEVGYDTEISGVPQSLPLVQAGYSGLQKQPTLHNRKLVVLSFKKISMVLILPYVASQRNF